MGLKYKKFQRRKAETEQDFELNIASIIDCFTVVITYLLLSASFISIGMLDTSSVEGEASAPADAKDRVELAVELKADRRIVLDLTGAIKKRLEIPASSGTWDFSKMEGELDAYTKSWPTLKSANLSAGNAVEYRDLVRGLEKVRAHIPAVYLAEEETP